MPIAPASLPLAQSASNTTGVLLWAGVLIVVAMVGGVVIAMVRRNMLGEPDAGDDGSMLDQMRRMVDRGEMSQQEFDLARRKIIERAQAARESRAPDSDPADPRG